MFFTDGKQSTNCEKAVDITDKYLQAILSEKEQTSNAKA
jgi:hypothetical protein